MDLLAEQKEYYRQRAAEYDQWWFREGRYALEPDVRERWFADVAEVERALDGFRPAGDVLELACGTGLWTRHLVPHASHVTAVDASVEVMALNRAKLPGAPVTYVEADLFEWAPPVRVFDVCFFGYWLSHVPADRLAGFWRTVSRTLRPGGRVFLVDSGPPATARDGVEERKLNDGRRFRVMKRYLHPHDLVSEAAACGLTLTASLSANGYILYAHGTATSGSTDP